MFTSLKSLPRPAAAGFILAVLLALLLPCCEMNADKNKGDGGPPGDDPPNIPEGFALEDASAAVSASGGSVRLGFSSDREGTFYALVLPADAEAPEDADGLKEAAPVPATGAMTAGTNTFTVSSLDPGGVYTAYITAEALETEAEAAARAEAEGAEEAEPAPVLSRVLTLSGIKPAPFTGISGTAWYMGPGRLTFGAGGTASIHGFNYAYTWDAASGTGWVSGHVNQRTGTVYDGKNTGDIINALGSYSVSMDGDYITGVTFSNYRDTPAQFSMTFVPARDPAEATERRPDGTDSLAGTCWWWLATSLVLEFLPNGKVLQWSTSGYYPHPHVYSAYQYDTDYVYDAYPGDTFRVGFIEVADSVCSYSGAIIPLGRFVIMDDFKDDRNVIVDQDLYFPGPEGGRHYTYNPSAIKGYKHYNHRADFARLTDD
jgi:hypothetical protein